MANRDPRASADIQIDTDNLYREEVFSDLRAASIRRLSPVRVDGSADESRPVLYVGDTTLMTQVGPLPVQFSIEAGSLAEAFARFPEGLEAAVAQLNERAKELVREEASRIVVPSAMPPGPGGGGVVPGQGGLPGGGKIVLK